MRIQVYADIVFLINLCMDHMLLSLMCMILRCRTTRARRLGAAAIGGLGSVLAFYVPSALGVPLQICLSILMCMTAAPCRTPRALFARTGVFYAASFVFGGGALALLCALDADVLVKNGAFYIDISLGVLAVSAIICYVLIYTADMMFKHAGIRFCRTAEVWFMGKKVTLRGYVDSGNHLMVSGVPVMLAGRDALAPLFPNENVCIEEWCPPDRIEYAIYNTVGGSGIITCIRTDCVVIDGVRCDAFVGVCPGSVSEEYDALLAVDMQ